MDLISANETVSRRNKVRVDSCIFQAFDDLGMMCVVDESVSDKIRRRCRKSIGLLNHIKGEWRSIKTDEKSMSDCLYVKSTYLEIYDKMMSSIEEVCKLSKKEKFEEALSIITECRSKLKLPNYKVNSILKLRMRDGKVSSSTKISNFVKGERVSYRLFDMDEKVIKKTLSEVDEIFEKSIENRGWDDPDVNTGKNWELCVCGGGGFFVRRKKVRYGDFAPVPEIEVEECPACDQDAGVRGLREKRKSSAPNKSRYPSYREHIEEIFGGEQFHPDML